MLAIQPSINDTEARRYAVLGSKVVYQEHFASQPMYADARCFPQKSR